MRVIVIGLGVQGKKRALHAGDDYVASVDPVNPDAHYRDVREVPLSDYDAALCCIPDEPKYDIVSYLLGHGKHVLVEKPLWTEQDARILELETLARAHQALCYTAYNHRFEPHFMRMRDLIASGELGRIYHCRMFYGNGTARLVRESAWRDQGSGVLPDLGSHLLDTCRFWFGDAIESAEWDIVSVNRFENRAPDHVVIQMKLPNFRIELEMTLLMWRNHFTCDILAEKGSAHIESLCKWGAATFTHRKRVLPSGRPTEEQTVLLQPDPTWEREYAHFKKLVEEKQPTHLAWDHSMLHTFTTLEKLIT